MKSGLLKSRATTEESNLTENIIPGSGIEDPEEGIRTFQLILHWVRPVSSNVLNVSCDEKVEK